MTAVEPITISATDAIPILAKARLMWTTVTVHFTDPANEIKQSMPCRLLDDHRTQGTSPDRKELVLEVPESLMPTVENLIGDDQPVQIEFNLDGQQFSCETVIKDMVVFFESVQAMILAWPGNLLLQPRRRAQRTKVILPEELVDPVYVRDISAFGCGIIWIQEPLLEINDRLRLKFKIPILDPKDPRQIVIHDADQVEGSVKRQSQFKGLPLYGVEFSKIKPALFFLIRQYAKIRQKEDAFYKKNQYYPQQVLPEIKATVGRE